MRAQAYNGKVVEHFFKVLENTIKINIPYNNNNELHIENETRYLSFYSFKDVNNTFVFALKGSLGSLFIFDLKVNRVYIPKCHRADIQAHGKLPLRWKNGLR